MFQIVYLGFGDWNLQNSANKTKVLNPGKSPDPTGIWKVISIVLIGAFRILIRTHTGSTICIFNYVLPSAWDHLIVYFLMFSMFIIPWNIRCVAFTYMIVQQMQFHNIGIECSDTGGAYSDFWMFLRTCSVVSLKRSNFHTSLTSTQSIGQCTNQSFCQLKLLDWILQREDPREEDI